MQTTKELTVFKFNEHTIRRVPGADGRILYCISDVCAALGIKKAWKVIARLTKGATKGGDLTAEEATRSSLPNSEGAGKNAPLSGKGKDNIYTLSNTDTDSNGVASGDVIWIDSQTAGGVQRMAYTDEVGLYDIISKSRKPLAKVLYRKLIEAVPSMRGSTGRSTPGIVSTEQVIIETHNMVKGIVQDVNVRLCRLEQTVSSIQSNQEMGFKLLKKNSLPEINSIDWRARLNQDIRNISLKFNWPEHDCWNMVYYEDKYRNHRDIKAIARNRGCRPIQVAEEKGWLLDLCAIARGIINGEIVTEYRAGAYS